MLKLKHPIKKIQVKKPDEKAYFQWKERLSKIPEHEQDLWIWETLQDKAMLPIFGRYFFPHIIKSPCVPECHRDLIREISSDQDSAIVYPRGFAKSTWEKIDTIHDVVYALEPVILYIANTLSDAQHHFESIKQELENNETLIEVYGNLVPADSAMSKKWTNKHFETTNGVNVVARGAGKGRGVNIKNNRPTKIIFDDIEDDEAVASPERRLKTHNWIYQVIFPSRDATRSKIKFIGTAISPLCEVLAFYKSHGGIFRKAIENGQSIWPEMFPLEKLDAIKVDIGTRAFMQEYQNTPTDPTVSLLRMEWIEPFYYNTLPPSALPLEIIIMMDPQSGSSKTADFYSISVVAKYPGDKHRYVLEVLTGRASQIEQAALLVRTYQRHKNVKAVGVEKVLTQVAVYQIILDWQSGKIDLPNVNNYNRNIAILPVEPEGKDKVARLQMHQPAFERGEIHLHMTQTALAEKLVSFPAVEHDDDLDALIYCLEYANRSNTSEFWKWQREFEESGNVVPGITAGLRAKTF